LLSSSNFILLIKQIIGLLILPTSGALLILFMQKVNTFRIPVKYYDYIENAHK
jgi:hypothetical protein